MRSCILFMGLSGKVQGSSTKTKRDRACLVQVKLAGELDAVAQDAIKVEVGIDDGTPVQTEHTRTHEDVEVGANVARPQRLPQPQHLRRKPQHIFIWLLLARSLSPPLALSCVSENVCCKTYVATIGACPKRMNLAT